MRQLQPHGTARPGDWFYVFGSVTQTGWVQIDERPAPIKSMTIREADEANKAPHFPVVVMRPNALERILRTPPAWKPNQHQIRKNRR